MTTPHLRLISFAACPYAQRTWIALHHKGAAFDLDFIDLSNKPGWFLELNPRGKVPVLVVDHDTVLYESMLLNLFVDELIPEPRMLSGSSIDRARQRMLMNESDHRLMPLMGAVLFARSAEAFAAAADTWADAWREAESVAARHAGALQLGDARGLSLADAAWAPLFDRLPVFERLWGLSLPPDLPLMTAWRDRVLEHSSVLPTRLPDLEARYRVYRDRQGFLPSPG